ncbi:MAG: TraR/DksA family transcriptional regulator [Gaiellaceae bacterium]
MSIDTERFQTLLLEERERVEHAIANQDDQPTVMLDREIDSIDASLKRIEEGTYGTCATCGREIPEQRLEAYPWAALCIDCKREAERG